MKNMIKLLVVCALAIPLGACSGNKQTDPNADAGATAGVVIETNAPAEEGLPVADTDNTYGAAYIAGGATLEPVYYALDKYSLSKDAMQTLVRNAEVIKATGINKIVVEGNCDERGTISYNISLGDKRAKEVKDYYITLGIPAANISTISYGEEKPLCFEQSEQCYSKNRRGDTVVK